MPQVNPNPAATAAAAADVPSTAQARLSFNPFDWPGQLLGDAASGAANAAANGLWKQIQPFILTMLFAAGGVALINIGAVKLVSDRVNSEVNDGMEKAGPLLGMVK